jgi:hypothetical protein
MFHPDIVSELAKMRQRELLEDAKKKELLKQIRFHGPRFADHLLLSFSEFLIAQCRKLEKWVRQRSGIPIQDVRT